MKNLYNASANGEQRCAGFPQPFPLLRVKVKLCHIFIKFKFKLYAFVPEISQRQPLTATHTRPHR